MVLEAGRDEAALAAANAQLDACAGLEIRRTGNSFVLLVISTKTGKKSRPKFDKCDSCI